MGVIFKIGTVANLVSKITKTSTSIGPATRRKISTGCVKLKALSAKVKAMRGTTMVATSKIQPSTSMRGAFKSPLESRKQSERCRCDSTFENDQNNVASPPIMSANWKKKILDCVSHMSSAIYTIYLRMPAEMLVHPSADGSSCNASAHVNAR